MVNTIAEASGVKRPSYFRQVIRYTLPVRMTEFAVVWRIFLR
jgi:hypothetical protein